MQARGSEALSSQREGGFDFTWHMRRLCADMTARLAELRHIDVRRIAFSFSQTRKPVAHGLYASLTPMRFEGGSLVARRHGRAYTVQRLYDPDGLEILYILAFYLPRFLNAAFEEKLTTVVHELWHISPQFNGDVRRHPGRCYAHADSQEKYDARMARMARRYLAQSPPPALYDFLRCRFDTLQQRYGRVYGLRVAHPKLIALPAGQVVGGPAPDSH